MKWMQLLLLLACADKRAATPAPAPAPAPDPIAAFDSRTPVPLPPMMVAHQREQMRSHLESVQAIIAGLAADDFDAIVTASAGIGPSEAMAAQCKHMGGGVAGFTEAALHFHETAGGIGAAAKRRDRAGVTTALGATLKECTSCHATYRQVVSGS